MSVRHCFYKDCPSTNLTKERSLFAFPYREPTRLRKWMALTGCTKEQLEIAPRFVCDLHFSSIFINNNSQRRRMLLGQALPNSAFDGSAVAAEAAAADTTEHLVEEVDGQEYDVELSVVEYCNDIGDVIIMEQEDEEESEEYSMHEEEESLAGDRVTAGVADVVPVTAPTMRSEASSQPGIAKEVPVQDNPVRKNAPVKMNAQVKMIPAVQERHSHGKPAAKRLCTEEDGKRLLKHSFQLGFFIQLIILTDDAPRAPIAQPELSPSATIISIKGVTYVQMPKHVYLAEKQVANDELLYWKNIVRAMKQQLDDIHF